MGSANRQSLLRLWIVRKLCDIRDGVKQCDYFDNDEIHVSIQIN